jgi:hypothetical protein
MSDPRFGMYTKGQGVAHETVNFEFAIAMGAFDLLFEAIGYSLATGERDRAGRPAESRPTLQQLPTDQFPIDERRAHEEERECSIRHQELG